MPLPRKNKIQLIFPLNRPWFDRACACRSHAGSTPDPIEETSLVPGEPNQSRGGKLMKTIAFINQKGGAGKSTCVLNLGGALAKMGYRTLIVDCDQQASITCGLLSCDVAHKTNSRDTVAGLYELDGSTNFRDIIQYVGRDNLALAPGSLRMQHFNVPDPWDTGPTSSS